MNSREQTKINMALEELSRDLTNYANYNNKYTLNNSRLDDQLIAQQLHNFTPEETEMLYSAISVSKLPNIVNLNNKISKLAILSGLVNLRNEIDTLHGVPSGSCSCDTYAYETIGVVYMQNVETYITQRSFEKWLRSGGTNMRILYDIDHNQSIFNMLWWNFESMLNDGNDYYNQRFDSVNDLQTFLQDNYGTDINVPISIKITAFRAVDKTDRLRDVGYNNLYSGIKCTKLMNENIMLTHLIGSGTITTSSDKYIRLRNMLSYIYQNMLGSSLSQVLTTESDYNNALSTLTFVKHNRNRYTYPRNSRAGSIFAYITDSGFYSKQSMLRAYNTVTKTWEALSINTTSYNIYVDAYMFYAENYLNNARGSYDSISLKSWFLSDECESIVKIARLRYTNASGQLCYFFRVYQTGVDQISIRRPLDTTNSVIIAEVFSDNKMPRYFKVTPKTTNDWGYRIDTTELKRIIGLSDICKSANKNLVPKFRFFYLDTSTGICSNYGNTYKLDWQSKGECPKIQPIK